MNNFIIIKNKLLDISINYCFDFLYYELNIKIEIINKYYILQINNTLDNIVGKKNLNYIESGYEEHLLDIIEDNHTILINGEFGTGKSTMLEHVFENEIYDSKKILKLKVYEEYVEDNYIDFLYSKLEGEKNLRENIISKFLRKNNKKIIIAGIDAGLLVILKMLSFRLTNGFSNTVSIMIILTGLYFIFLVLKEVSESKIEKISFIKNELKNYDYVVIDDLDRIYIDTKEILKMIHFLSEEQKGFKLILISDKKKFIENEIDILEKYYDISFEIPNELIVQSKVQIFVKELEDICYQDDLDDVEKILRELSIRELNKVINHYKNDKNSQITNNLFRSDYLFMIIIYYRYGSYDNVVDTLIQIQEMFNDWNIYNSNGEQQIFDKSIELINELELSSKEKLYLMNNVAYSKEKKVYSGKINANETHIGIRVAENRLIDYPIEYKINSFYLDKLNFNKIETDFTYWLENDIDMINGNVFRMYEHLDKDKANKEVIQFINNNYDVGRNLYSYVKAYVIEHEEIVRDYPNVKYLSLYVSSSGLNDKNKYIQIVESLKEIWNDTSNSVKLEILEIEYFAEEDNFLKIVLNNDVLINKISDKMIKKERPYRFYDFFNKKLQVIDVNNIQEIISQLSEFVQNIKNNDSSKHDKDLINQIKKYESDIDSLKNYLQQKDTH